MHDIRPQPQAGPVAADLAAAFGVTAAQVEAAMPVIAAEFAALLEQATLSRAGLADLIEAVGGRWARPLDKSEALHSETMRTNGNAALVQVLGSMERARGLMDRLARAGRLGEGTVEAMLPALAAVTLSGLAGRAKDSLAGVMSVMPPLGHWSRGEPCADLADIVRRRCGAGPYGPAKLRRVVRRDLARASGFEPRGPVRWYVRFMLAPVMVPMRGLAASLGRST